MGSPSRGHTVHSRRSPSPRALILPSTTLPTNAVIDATTSSAVAADDVATRGHPSVSNPTR